MIRPEFSNCLSRVIENPKATETDLIFLLDTINQKEQDLLFTEAARIRNQYCGARMILRGLVEFSSYCGNSCFYCGLNRTNSRAERYRLSPDQIVESARLVWNAGIKTIVLQSGEDGMEAQVIADVVYRIKAEHDMAITLSVGERPRKDYALWKDAGADRYLLRFESTNPELYASLHNGRTLETRLQCLDTLQELGYQTGSGFMVGTPGQTLEIIAQDIRFLAQKNYDMIGIGPFIPHPDTPLRNAPAGDIHLTLRAVALIRLTSRNAWLPATTAVGSLDRDYRVDALQAGANVLMPNFSPLDVKRKYGIYPGKRCVTETTADTDSMEDLARAAGLTLDYSRADTLK
ncbi:MAG TPA: [FeFe] hydrogenase H-cluster radical SAM maturase HydE [Treponema sp.]|nr:[FeFe] hydrogenase H-cluster radical SAM maturase HydE [Treponema sp.]